MLGEDGPDNFAPKTPGKNKGEDDDLITKNDGITVHQETETMRHIEGDETEH